MVNFKSLELTGRHLRAARAMLGWRRETLARKALVGIGTIQRMESTDDEIVSSTVTLGRVRHALIAAGVEFLPGPKVGVLLIIK